MNKFLATASIVLSLVGSAQAAEFKLEKSMGKNIISMEGKIEEGDMKKFVKALWSIKRGEKLWLLDLNSPGGSLMEAEKIAEWVYKQNNLAVSVNNSNTCASACFMIFSAGQKKFVHEKAEISVHSVQTSDGKEDITALAMTTAMARDCAQMGVPNSIIGKMVTTKPSDLSVLTQKDLKDMKAVIFSDENME